MERCGAKRRDLYVGKEHVFALLANTMRTEERCKVHTCRPLSPLTSSLVRR